MVPSMLCHMWCNPQESNTLFPFFLSLYTKFCVPDVHLNKCYEISLTHWVPEVFQKYYWTNPQMFIKYKNVPRKSAEKNLTRCFSKWRRFQQCTKKCNCSGTIFWFLIQAFWFLLLCWIWWNALIWSPRSEQVILDSQEMILFFWKNWSQQCEDLCT